MSYTQTTTLSLYKPDFGHVGWRELYNSNFDTLDARFGVASFTSGSVIFADGSGKLSQDNASLSYASNLLTVGRTVTASSFNLQRFQRSGATKGSFGLDANDWFVMRGANATDAIKISSTDQIVFGDPSVSAPATRFRFGDDVQINGVLRIGVDATFGAAAIDPDGGIQLGRAITAQNHGIVRFYRNGTEFGRIGMDAGDRLSLMQGASDSPSLTVGATGELYFPAIGTTASAANVFVNNGSSPVNQVLRSTSSRKYKTDIAPVSHDDFEKLFVLRPVTYRSLAEADDPNKQWFGFVAEEVAEIEPRLVHFSDGQPDGVQYDRLTVLLVGAIQSLEMRVRELER